MVQQGLGLTGGVQAQVQGQHILPGPVEEGDLPAAVGAGDGSGARLLQVLLCLLLRESGGGEAIGQTCPEQTGNVRPQEGRYIIAHKGVPAVAVDGQQTLAAPQVDHMEIPAKAPVWL